MKKMPEPTERKQPTYEEMQKIEAREESGLWKAFERGEFIHQDIGSFLVEIQKAGDHKRSIFYAERLAEYHEKQGLKGLAKHYREIAKLEQQYVREEIHADSR